MQGKFKGVWTNPLFSVGTKYFMWALLITTDIEAYIFPLYNDKVLNTVYQGFIEQINVVRAASWAHYVNFCINTHALLKHACMQKGFSGVRMSPLVQ